MVQQLERFLLPARFVEQHGQAAVTLGVVRIALQALVVQVLGLLQVARAVVERARFVQRRGQVVVAFRRAWVLGDRLLEAVGRLLIVALLIEPHAFDVGGLRLDVAAAACGDEQTRQAQRPIQPSAKRLCIGDLLEWFDTGRDSHGKSAEKR